MSKIKLIIFGIITVMFIVLGLVIAIQNTELKSLKKDYSIAAANNAALLTQNDSNKNQVRSLQLTIEQLEYYNDSVLKKLNKAKQDLKIKDKNLKELQYLKTLTSKTDTVYFKDTIFVKDVCLDTTIQDKWAKTNLKLCYPNEVRVCSEFESEKTIVTHIRKETIDPPDKCWFVRMFQKKHKVLEVDIIENNPYITTKEYKHIEIIK